MISCDFNATNASDEEDVFTLARDKGAKGAVSITNIFDLVSWLNFSHLSAPILTILPGLCDQPGIRGPSDL